MTALRLRAAVVVGGVLLALAGGAAPALAHGDVGLVDDVVDLAPGASTAFEGELHYDRVTTALRADGPVLVELVHAATGEVAARQGPAREVRLAALVRCCEEVVWATHRLVLTNPGDAPVTATVRARLVHDDLAVMVDGAESGTRVSIVLIGAAWAALLWRAVRRRSHEVPLRRAVVRLGTVAGAVVVLAAWGAWRYGTAGPGGVLAAAADVPVLPLNPIVSRASLLVAVAIVWWGRAGTAWARAPEHGSPGWWATGVALFGAVVVVAVSVAVTYGRAGAAIGAAVAAGLPLLAVPFLRRRAVPVVAGPPTAGRRPRRPPATAGPPGRRRTGPSRTGW